MLALIIFGIVFLLLALGRGLGLSGWGPKWLVRFALGNPKGSYSSRH